MIHVVVRVATPGVVTNPLVIAGVNVWSFRMSFLVSKRSVLLLLWSGTSIRRRPRWRAADRRRSAWGNVASANPLLMLWLCVLLRRGMLTLLFAVSSSHEN
jgi:hypothetical protein